MFNKFIIWIFTLNIRTGSSLSEVLDCHSPEVITPNCKVSSSLRTNIIFGNSYFKSHTVTWYDRQIIRNYNLNYHLYGFFLHWIITLCIGVSGYSKTFVILDHSNYIKIYLVKVWWSISMIFN